MHPFPSIAAMAATVQKAVHHLLTRAMNAKSRNNLSHRLHPLFTFMQGCTPRRQVRTHPVLTLGRRSCGITVFPTSRLEHITLYKPVFDHHRDRFVRQLSCHYSNNSSGRGNVLPNYHATILK